MQRYSFVYWHPCFSPDVAIRASLAETMGFAGAAKSLCPRGVIPMPFLADRE